MPLTAAHRCQICGDVLFHGNLFSDPSQHFCLTVNGPGMVDSHAEDCDIVSTTFTSLVKALTDAPALDQNQRQQNHVHTCTSNEDTQSWPRGLGMFGWV
jgi:hypothetical protein